MQSLNIPAAIHTALSSGAACAVSVSGGKDSQALLLAVLDARRTFGWSGPVFAIHADLGRAEWEGSEDHVRRMCADAGVELRVVQRAGGDMLDRLTERADKLAGTGKPFWPSSAARYCTSDMKRNPINMALRGYDQVVSVEGVRAAESAARAKKPACAVRSAICGKALLDGLDTEATAEDQAAQAVASYVPGSGRLALDWRPLLDWTDSDVWDAIGTSSEDVARRRALTVAGDEATAVAGFPAHPAYALGNVRLSCSLCVLGCRSDLVNGAKRNPAYFQALLALEQRTGHTFKVGTSLDEIGREAGLLA